MLLAAIGDIHGERWKLEGLLRKLPEEARLVFLGDYVDRGPDAHGTISDLIALRERRPNTVFLRGNHDQMMLDAGDYFDPDFESDLTFDQVVNWFGWGGTETLRSYQPHGEGHWFHRVPEAHWEFLEDTELEYREGPYIFVHAGLLPPGVRWEPDVSWSLDPRLWIREPFLQSMHDFGARVVFGHTVQRHGPLVRPNKIGIDTGAVFGGPLSAAILDTERPDWVEFVEAR
ncbi:MAG: metallophosphoesterase family protein [Fimbriimonas sp.]